MEIDDKTLEIFMEAVVSDRAVAVTLLLANPQLVDARVLWGETCLHYLATEGAVDGVRFLATNGFDVNAANKYGDTPLYDSATISDSTPGCRDVVRALLDACADPNKQSSFGRTPLIAVVAKGDVELAQALLDHGADANQADEYFGPPLGVAVKTRRADLVQLLLDYHAMPNYRTTFGDDVSTGLHSDDEHIKDLLIKYGWRGE